MGSTVFFIIVSLPDTSGEKSGIDQEQVNILLHQARCPVFLAKLPDIPRDASRD